MIGVDIVNVERIKSLAEKDKNNKVFLTSELDYVSSKSNVSKIGDKFSAREYSLAGIFASKEALSKAFGVGIGDQIGFSDIEINHEENGKPFFVMNSKISSLLKSHNASKINLSISHDAGIAIAVVEIV